MLRFLTNSNPLDAAFHGGDEDRLVEELGKVSGRRNLLRTVVRILEETKSPRVRNAAALALTDMHAESVKGKLVDVLKRPDTEGCRGTILYALDELGGDLPLSLLVDLIAQDSYEAREEALGFLASGKVEYDEDRYEMRQKLMTALESADEEKAHAVNTAIQYMS
jgi:hypothetical protein